MRHFLKLALVFILLCVCSGCYSYDYVEELEIKNSNYEELISDYEEQIEYYRMLCDNFGYQTYDGVYNPEMWKYYNDNTHNTVHVDWLCEKADTESAGCKSSRHEFFTEHGYTLCECCDIERIYFLDMEEGVFHYLKSCLDLGTDDYIRLNKVYCLVSYNSAISSGYEYCSVCGEWENK